MLRLSRHSRLFFTLLILICSCGNMAYGVENKQSSTLDIVTPVSDQREYQYLELENGLRVFIISDSEAERSAAALDVNVGSGNDPADRMGLAHFLEHMLFLGTKKYPSSSEFQDFVTGHGGQHNAYTSLEHTAYVFDIENSAFAQGLDRFAQFFISPLFDQTYIERERNAVHSEFRSKYRNEGRRQMDVLRTVLDSSHPLAKFSTGNLDTLNVDSPRPLYDDLVRFYKEHYSADNMSLVLVSNQSVAALAALSQELFGDVPKRQVKNTITSSAEFIAKDRLPAEIQIQPLTESRTLSLLFPVPPTVEYYREKPLSYLGFFLGHEGKGSLLSALKTHNWVTALSAGAGMDWPGGELFSVQMELTEEGVKHIADIEALFFEYTALLKNKGIAKWRFEEMKKSGQMNFQYADKISAYREAMYYSRSMHDVPIRDIFSSLYLFENYDEKLIRRYLSYLSPRNLVRKIVAPGVESEQVSPFYQTPYVFMENVAVKAACQSDVCNSLKQSLALPEPNSYLPENFTLQGKTEQKQPILIDQADAYKVWYAPDNEFELPVAYVKARFKLPDVASSAEGYIAAKIALELLKESMNETAYAASMGGLSYQLKTNSRGIDLNFSGYDDSLDKLVLDVASDIRKYRKNKKYRKALNKKYFEQIRNDFIREHKNKKLATPYHQLLTEMPAVLYHPYWSWEEENTALENITFDSFSRYSERLLDTAQAEVFIYGNWTSVEARAVSRPVLKIIKSFDGVFGVKRAKSPVIAEGVVVNLPQTDTIPTVEVPVNHQDKAVVAYYQGPDDTLATQARMRLLGQSIETLFYHRLRTEQQLGYIVNASFYPIREVPAIVALVQSPSVEPEKILEHIHQFFIDSESQVFAQLERDKQALINILTEKAQGQAEQVNQWWTSILVDDLTFDEYQRMADLVRGFTLEDMKTFYRSVFVESAKPLVVLTPISAQSALPLRKVEDYEAFRAKQKAYVYP